MSYSIGDKVIIDKNNDNENYNEFRDKVLIVEDICPYDHPAYDMGVYPQQLLGFITEDNKEVPFMLYEYEIVSL